MNETPIELLIFDLDNTLYPASSKMASQIHHNMKTFAASYLGMSVEESEPARIAGYLKWGTTMRWLQEEHGMADIEEFLDLVHPANVAELIVPDPELAPLLHSFSVPKVVLTNSPTAHAQRVLAHLGISDAFEDIFDLERSDYKGKPSASAYLAVTDHFGVAAGRCLFLDDIESYADGFTAVGGNSVLIDESGKKDYRPSIKSVHMLGSVLRELTIS